MTRCLRLVVCLLCLAVLLGPSGTGAGEQPSAAGEVRFASAPVPPTKLQIRLARERGRAVSAAQPGTELTGRLSRPRGSGPFPAVVLLHGCAGRTPAQDAWAAELAAWGYAALQIDSHGARGLTETCTTTAGPNVGPRVPDAFGALAWLRGQPLVDPRRVAVMGWGHGGTAALDSVLATGVASLLGEGFTAAVALYPYCPGNIARRYLAPILVLAGAEDDLMPAARCRRIAAKAETGGGMITLRVYEGAYYGFDDPDHGAPHLEPEVLNIERSPPRGATVGYDAAAHSDARRRVRAFLDQLLGQVG